MAEHIQIGDISPRNQITITGQSQNGPWDFSFPIFEDADMEVFYDTIQKSLTTHFTISGAGNSDGGTVSPVAGQEPDIDAVVTIRRNIAVKRTSDFQESGEFRAKVINDELDKLTATQQQIESNQDRSLRLGPTDSATTTVIPDKATRSSKVLGFDENGDPVVSTQDLVDIEGGVAAAAASAAQAAIDAAAAANDAATADVDATNAAASAAAAAAVAAGINWKNSLKAGTTGNITLSGAQTIDGISVVASDRVLVKDQTAGEDNGIYVVASGAWTRDTPADDWDELVCAAVNVQEGTVNADKAYICTSDSGGTLGVTAITFAKFGGGDIDDAGEGLGKSGSSLYLDIGGLTDGGWLMQPTDYVVVYDTSLGAPVKAATPTLGARIIHNATVDDSGLQDSDPLIYENSGGSLRAATPNGIVKAAASQYRAFDMPFEAGMDYDYSGEDIAVQTYADFIMSRDGSFSGEVGNIGTAGTGSAVIVDITKNGASIYSTLPQFAAGATSLTAGALKSDGTEDFVSGDLIIFRVTQKGSSTAGQKLRFTAKAEVI